MNEPQIDLDEVEALCAVVRDDEERTWHDRQDAMWQLLDVDGTVSALVAEVRRLRASAGLEVHITHEIGKPATCRVARNGLTLFEGQDFSAIIPPGIPVRSSL